MSTVRVRVDRDACVGGGLCVLLAPEVFDQSEEDGRVLLTAEPDQDDRAVLDAVVSAGYRCPAGAITVDDD